MCRYSFIFLAVLTFPFQVFAGVVINEVLFDPAGFDTGLEWVELYNSGTASENISGWELYPDGVGYFTFPGNFSIPSRGFVVVRLRTAGTNTATDLYFPQAAGNMGNTSGSTALFSGEPRGKDTMKSFVQWGRSGETWETDAEKAGLWTKGTFISGLIEGNSIGLSTDGIAGGGSSAWKVSASTAGSYNNPVVSGAGTGALAGETNVATTSALSQSQSAASFAVVPKIKVFAGEDRTVMVGSYTNFQGYALGLKDEPLENARFWWNFGDGEFYEGRAANHLFQVPGKYTVGLHISSGGYAASDYLLVNIIPNKILIQEVVEGEGGFIRLVNPSEVNIDIGGWSINSGSENYTIPPMTRISARADIALRNKTTGLLKTGVPLSSLVVKYPNLEPAFEWNRQKPRGTQISQSSPLKTQKTAEKVSFRPANDAPKDQEKFAATEIGTHQRSQLFFFGIAAMGSILAAAGFLVIKHFIR